ncbi:Acyl-CoA synthetase short-chain member 3, mitochondrial [Cichlidogyrus casuarinus]|uniref:Acyl-CoA synthetase short-chain family member 3, mitochondrial n=1 Tax=Cichlidogyrus casuarinus TaxID=1844966 RepID=A0ABD2Q634_9PLAT
MWDKTLEKNQMYNAEWFRGGRLSLAYNALDRHVDAGLGNRTAVIYDSPMLKTSTKLTYEQLKKQVAKFATVLKTKCDVKKGDRVLIYMPMVPQCLIAMLACARIGAIHAVVFGGFNAPQLATRIAHSQAKCIVTSSFGVEPNKLVDYKQIVDAAIVQAHAAGVRIEHCVVYNRPEFPKIDIKRATCDTDTAHYDFEAELTAANECDPVIVDSSHPLYILYTSGTTGLPKGLVRSTGDYAVALNWSMKNIYDMNPGETWLTCSDFGWVLGHSYLTYGPLLQGSATIIYEGKPVNTPDSTQYMRLLDQYNVSSAFMTPSALRAIRKDDPNLNKSQDYLKRIRSKLRNLFLAGERCDHCTMEWIKHHLGDGVFVSDNWWQTETGWALTASCAGLLSPEEKKSIPVGSAGRPVPGIQLELAEIKSEEKHVHEEKELKQILIKLPMPPGFARTMWMNEDKFKNVYFAKYPGFYDSMDGGFMDDNNFLYIMTRVDDVINVAGHRLSTSALEEACIEVNGVVECAVVALPDKIKGHVPIAFVVISSDFSHSFDQIQKVTEQVAKHVRKVIGPVATIKQVLPVPALPKTRSGKISRVTLAQMAAGEKVKVPVTIEDISVYTPIYELLQSIGMNPSSIDDC